MSWLIGWDEPRDDGYMDDDEREEAERRRDDEAMDAWDEERIRAWTM